MSDLAPGQGFADLVPGDPLPRYFQQGDSHRRFAWDNMAGRYLLFCPFLTDADPAGRGALDAIAREAARFDERFASAIAVGVEQSDAVATRLQGKGPGVRLLWDPDLQVSRTLGAIPLGAIADGQAVSTRRAWVLVDPTLHVLAVVPFEAADPEHRAVFGLMDGLPPPERFGDMTMPAPVLVLPNVLGPDLRQKLIAIHQSEGGAVSHVVLEGTATVDGSFKRRTDCPLTDRDLLRQISERLARCVAPEVQKLFFMQLNHFDRPQVSCYAAEDGGHYWPHRDIGSPRTAHRRFAVSVNLNDDFEGGEVYFPEYCGARFKAPAGWAVVFPCAALHGVSTVTKGRRYAFLPFMFDDEGARIKAANISAKT